MSSHTIINALTDIPDNIFRIWRFVGSLDLESFIANDKTFFASVRALEIISEASRRLPEGLRARHPALSWRGMRDAGNFYRHQYDNVSGSLVWTTIHGDLSRLLDAVEQELRALGRLT